MLPLIQATQLCTIKMANLLMTEVTLSTNLVDRSTFRMHQSKISFCLIQQMMARDGIMLEITWEKLLGMILKEINFKLFLLLLLLPYQISYLQLYQMLAWALVLVVPAKARDFRRALVLVVPAKVRGSAWALALVVPAKVRGSV